MSIYFLPWQQSYTDPDGWTYYTPALHHMIPGWRSEIDIFVLPCALVLELDKWLCKCDKCCWMMSSRSSTGKGSPVNWSLLVHASHEERPEWRILVFMFEVARARVTSEIALSATGFLWMFFTLPKTRHCSEWAEHHFQGLVILELNALSWKFQMTGGDIVLGMYTSLRSVCLKYVWDSLSTMAVYVNDVRVSSCTKTSSLVCLMMSAAYEALLSSGGGSDDCGGEN